MVRPHQYVWVGSFGFILGVGLGGRFELATTSIIVAVSLLLGSLILRPPTIIKVVGVFLIAGLVGWWRCESVLAARPDYLLWKNQTVAIAGRVVSDPETIGTKQRLHLAIQRINEQPANLRVLLTSWHLPIYHYADALSGQVKLTLPKDSEEFKYSNYLAKDNIYLTATQSGKLTAVPSSHSTLLGGLYRIKHRLNVVIHRFLPEPQAGLLSGLLLGIKADLPESFKDALKNSGTSHIVALSGFNITIIISFLLSALRRLPRRWVWALSGLLILGFIIMTGAASSVVRAAIMGWVLLLASYWGRRHSPINAVLLAVVTMIAIHPLILMYDVGFQLSVAATMGLVYVTPLFVWHHKYLPLVISEAFTSTIGATLFTLPLVALYFGGISWVTLGANLLVVPLVPYVMLIGCLGLVGFWLWPALQWLVIFVWPLSALLLNIIYWFGNLPSAFIPLPPLPVWIPLVYYTSLGLIIVYVGHRRSLAKKLV